MSKSLQIWIVIALAAIQWSCIGAPTFSLKSDQRECEMNIDIYQSVAREECHISARRKGKELHSQIFPLEDTSGSEGPHGRVVWADGGDSAVAVFCQSFRPPRTFGYNFQQNTVLTWRESESILKVANTSMKPECIHLGLAVCHRECPLVGEHEGYVGGF